MEFLEVQRKSEAVAAWFYACFEDNTMQTRNVAGAKKQQRAAACQGLENKCDGMVGKLETFLTMSCPRLPEQGRWNRTSPGIAAHASKDSKSWGKSVAMRQVKPQSQGQVQ